MKLVTFQPIKVSRVLKTEGVYKAQDNDTFMNKIFCLKLDKSTMERVFAISPSMPQVMIVFETEDYEELDYIKWVNKIFLNKSTRGSSKYKEYMVNEIKESCVIRYEIISTSTDVQEVQNNFMDHHFMELEMLSGNSWYRFKDKDWWETVEAQEYVNKICSCMIPQTVLTENYFDEAMRLIRKYFIKNE